MLTVIKLTSESITLKRLAPCAQLRWVVRAFSRPGSY